MGSGWNIKMMHSATNMQSTYKSLDRLYIHTISVHFVNNDFVGNPESPTIHQNDNLFSTSTIIPLHLLGHLKIAKYF